MSFFLLILTDCSAILTTLLCTRLTFFSHFLQANKIVISILGGKKFVAFF